MYNLNYIVCEISAIHSAVHVLHTAVQHSSRTVELQVWWGLNFVHVVSSLPKQKHSQIWICLGMFLLFFLRKYKRMLQTKIPLRCKMDWVIKAVAPWSRTGSWSEHLPGLGRTGYEFLALVKNSRVTPGFLISYISPLFQTSFLLFFCRKKNLGGLRFYFSVNCL